MTVQHRVLVHLMEQQRGAVLADIAAAVYASIPDVVHALGALQLRGLVASRQRVYRITDLGVVEAPRFVELVRREKQRPVGLLRQSERGDHSNAHSDVAAARG